MLLDPVLFISVKIKYGLNFQDDSGIWIEL